MPENEQRRDVERAVREQDAAPLHSRQEIADVACHLGAGDWPHSSPNLTHCYF